MSTGRLFSPDPVARCARSVPEKVVNGGRRLRARRGVGDAPDGESEDLSAERGARAAHSSVGSSLRLLMVGTRPSQRVLGFAPLRWRRPV